MPLTPEERAQLRDFLTVNPTPSLPPPQLPAPDPRQPLTGPPTPSPTPSDQPIDWRRGATIGASSLAGLLTSPAGPAVSVPAAALAGGSTQALIDAFAGGPEVETEGATFRAVREGATQGLYELGGAALGGVAQKIMAPNANKIYSEALDAVTEMQARVRAPANLIRNAPRRWTTRKLLDQSGGAFLTGRNNVLGVDPISGYSPSLLGQVAGIRPDLVSFAHTNDTLFKIANKHTVSRDVMMNLQNYSVRELIEGPANEMLSTIGAQTAPEDLARMVATTIRGDDNHEGFLNIATAPAKTIYNAIADQYGGTIQRVRRTGVGRMENVVEDRVGGARVNYEAIALDRRVREVISEYQNSPKYSSGDLGIDGIVRNFIATALPRARRGQALPIIDKNIVFAQQERAALRAKYRSAMATNDNKATRAAVRRIYNALDQSFTREMTRGLDAYQTGAGNLLTAADRIYAEGMQTYSPASISRLLSLTDTYQWKEAGDLINRIIGPGHGGNTMKGERISTIRRALTDPETGRQAEGWYRLREFYNAEALRRAKDTTSGLFNATQLRNWIKQEEISGRARGFYQGDGAESLQAIRAMADASDAIRTRGASLREPTLVPGYTTEGEPTFLYAVVQPTKMANGIIKRQVLRMPLISGPFAGRIASRLLNNGATAKWLTTGFKLPAGSRASAAFITKLQMEAAKEQQYLAVASELAQAKIDQAKRWVMEDQLAESYNQGSPPGP